jgi:hypothetical protein
MDVRWHRWQKWQATYNEFYHDSVLEAHFCLVVIVSNVLAFYSSEQYKISDTNIFIQDYVHVEQDDKSRS